MYLAIPSDSDAEEIARLANDPEIAYNVASIGEFPHPYGLNDAGMFIEMSKNAVVEKTGYHFCVYLSGSGKVAGSAGVVSLENEKRSCEIGYWLGKEHWGRGYAKEAIILLMAFCFNSIGIETVRAKVFNFNRRSIKTLESVGFIKEGSKDQDEIYSMGRDTFKASYMEIFNNTSVSA
ncbi:MAG: GNAT family N-acetyltransferase [Candidatus Marsarchaeota archaeon]|nr:GNAT family N-acetyltransferase [Candidatus Marsarchaeota archaeon]MCL5111493.1 GNAT family N-acetyltransferase [Candidatus Marsarchaeota archaeon]